MTACQNETEIVMEFTMPYIAYQSIVRRGVDALRSCRYNSDGYAYLRVKSFEDQLIFEFAENDGDIIFSFDATNYCLERCLSSTREVRVYWAGIRSSGKRYRSICEDLIEGIDPAECRIACSIKRRTSGNAEIANGTFCWSLIIPSKRGLKTLFTVEVRCYFQDMSANGMVEDIRLNLMSNAVKSISNILKPNVTADLKTVTITTTNNGCSIVGKGIRNGFFLELKPGDYTCRHTPWSITIAYGFFHAVISAGNGEPVTLGEWRDETHNQCRVFAICGNMKSFIEQCEPNAHALNLESCPIIVKKEDVLVYLKKLARSKIRTTLLRILPRLASIVLQPGAAKLNNPMSCISELVPYAAPPMDRDAINWWLDTGDLIETLMRVDNNAVMIHTGEDSKLSFCDPDEPIPSYWLRLKPAESRSDDQEHELNIIEQEYINSIPDVAYRRAG